MPKWSEFKSFTLRRFGRMVLNIDVEWMPWHANFVPIFVLI